MGRPKGSKNKPKVTESAPSTTVTMGTNIPATKTKRTVAEMKEWYEKNTENTQEAFKKIRDVTKTGRQTTLNSYSKDNVISYLQNISSNENNLRNLSRYLFYRSQVYFRLVMYNATMFDLNARTVIPQYDPIKTNNPNKILKSYYETLQWLDRMNLQHEFLSVLVNNFIEDVFYGCCWIDETGIFILQLPPEYCKINGKFFTGDFHYEVDMSYYKKYEYLIEYLGEPFSSMYSAYGGDNAKRWQPMPDEYTLCTKYRLESWETVCPPYSGLFLDLIGLLNLSDVQAVADEQQIYKLITATIPLLDNSDVPDDWAVDVNTALEYYRKLDAALPPYIGSIITPIPLDTISFSDDQATDTTKVHIEIHHEPLSLYDICLIVYNKRVAFNEPLDEEYVAKEVMYLHYNLMVGLIPLAETVHQLVHAQYLFVPTTAVLGKYREFVDRYQPYMIPEQLETLEHIEEATKVYDSDDAKLLLSKNYIYIDMSGSYNLPKTEDIISMVKDRIKDILDAKT